MFGLIIGQHNGEKLTALLKEHIELGGLVIVAAKNNKDLTPIKKIFAHSTKISQF